MNLPRWADLKSFGAAARNNRPVLQLHGLVLDRPKDSVRQATRFTPGLAVVVAQTEHAPPLNGIRADLIVKLQRAFLGLEEHRIPTGESLAVGLSAFGDLHRSRPLAVHLPGHPDGDVGLTLGLTGEPSRDQRAILRLDNRRGMATGHRVRLEDELGADQARFSRDARDDGKQGGKDVTHGVQTGLPAVGCLNKPT